MEYHKSIHKSQVEASATEHMVAACPWRQAGAQERAINILKCLSTDDALLGLHQVPIRHC